MHYPMIYRSYVAVSTEAITNSSQAYAGPCASHGDVDGIPTFYYSTCSLLHISNKMQALKLSKKYPEFKQDEIFDLVNKFK
jgi:hypothetical protein